MADPRDYINSAAAQLQQGISQWQANKKQEEFLNTELHPDLQSAFMPAPRPQVGATKYDPEVSSAFDSALDSALSGFGGLASEGQAPAQGAQVGMEHPEIKRLAKLVEEGMNPLVAAKQARAFTNRDMPAIKLAMEAREQQARNEWYSARSEGTDTPESRERRARIAADARNYGADRGYEGRKYSADASYEARDLESGRRLEGARYGADQSRAGAEARARATVEAARERAAASERIATQRFGTRNAYVNDLIKTLKVKADAMGKAGAQLDIMRNADQGGVNKESLRKRQAEYDDAVREYNSTQKMVDELLEEGRKGGQPEQHGSSTTIERGSRSERAQPTSDGQPPFEVRQTPGQPLDPRLTVGRDLGAVDVVEPGPERLLAPSGTSFPPLGQPSSGTTRQGNVVNGPAMTIPPGAGGPVRIPGAPAPGVPQQLGTTTVRRKRDGVVKTIPIARAIQMVQTGEFELVR